jgi:hypothetical protein
MVGEVCAKCGELVGAGERGNHYRDVIASDEKIPCKVVGCGAMPNFFCTHSDGSKTLACPHGHRQRFSAQRLG